jgi:hypothetical protein
MAEENNTTGTPENNYGEFDELVSALQNDGRFKSGLEARHLDYLLVTGLPTAPARPSSAKKPAPEKERRDSLE